jgi:hypothetical protein
MLAKDKAMLEEKLRAIEEEKKNLIFSSAAPLTLRVSHRKSSSDCTTRRLDTLPRDVVFSILAFVSDEDLYSLSIVNKRLCMFCFSDLLVFERRLKKRFPFDMGAMWRVISKKVVRFFLQIFFSKTHKSILRWALQSPC